MMLSPSARREFKKLRIQMIDNRPPNSGSIRVVGGRDPSRLSFLFYSSKVEQLFT
jgi:hypothetical protein